jgi:hypothetical protein
MMSTSEHTSHPDISPHVTVCNPTRDRGCLDYQCPRADMRDLAVADVLARIAKKAPFGESGRGGGSSLVRDTCQLSRYV